jgi:phenylacetate-CoA ligase
MEYTYGTFTAMAILHTDLAPHKRADTTEGFSQALSLFTEASQRVPAYKDFLAKHSVDPTRVATPEDFASVPRTDKHNYIGQYSLSEMSWDGTLGAARYISTSSGSTGVPFFWPRGTPQDAVVGEMFRTIFTDIYDLKDESLLFVNSFAFGTWIAGFEFYNATKWAGDHGLHTTSVTPGIDKVEAVNQIKKLAPLFDRIVLAGYPPFVKDILAFGAECGIDWSALDLRLLVGGEAVSILWKKRIAEHIGKAHTYSSFVNIYGMAECGVVAHDTPLAQLVREHLLALPEGMVTTHDGLPVTGLYQYYPGARYFEAQPGEALALTANAGLPLIRYDTRDTGGILSRGIVEQMGPDFAQEAERLGIDTARWQLPFIYLNGRKDLSISFYALNIFVENIKYILERSVHQEKLSGLFTMSVEHTDDLDQQFIVRVELEDHVADRTFAGGLAEEIYEKLQTVNSEYQKLSVELGKERVLPEVVLLSPGEFLTIPGRKHKWIRR